MKTPKNTPEKQELVGKDPKNGRFVGGNKLGGRRPMPADVKEMLKAATPDAVKLLVATMRDDGQKIDMRVRCAELIIERVHGKAVQPIDGETTTLMHIVIDGSDDLAV